MVGEPDKRLYSRRSFQKYPGWLTTAALVVIAYDLWPVARQTAA